MVETGVPFFGVGAMRAGTTWLSEVLESYPDCKMTPFKEIHFFDVRYGKYGGAKHYRSKAKRLETLGRVAATRMIAELDAMADEKSGGHQTKANEVKPEPTGAADAWADETRTRFFEGSRVETSLARLGEIADYFSMRDVESYVSYLRRHATGAAAFGEITPAYSLLPAAGFAEMDKALPGARFIFIMRDPVERLWSHARYFAGKATTRRGREVDPNEVFEKALQRPGAMGRSSYHRTVSELERAIPVDRILYLFYETVTSPKTGPDEMRRIENALGLNHVETDGAIFAKPVNASPPAKLDPRHEEAAIELFRPVYSFVEKRFGRQPRWRSA
jgi:hypothetical protein